MNSRGNTSEKNVPLCPPVSLGPASGAICLNKLQVVISHLWPSLFPFIGLWIQESSADGTSPYGASWKSVGVFSEHREQGSCRAIGRQTGDLAGRVSQRILLWHEWLRIAPWASRRNVKYQSLEPSFSSHNTMHMLYICLNEHCMQNCMKCEEIATLLCWELY